MVYCLNISCGNPHNPDGYKFCQACGSQLRLRNRYRIIKPIGSGGFGRTYRAVDEDCMNSPCVVKQFSPSPEIQARSEVLKKATELFNKEAVRLFELGEHPQIPRLLAHFEQDNFLYLVQEWIDGQDLMRELEQQGVLSERKIRQLLLNLLPVLKFVHERGVIHRDIKPGNIMRRRTLPQAAHQGGQKAGLVLIDFGVSTEVTATALGKVGTTVGTPGYAPLEQLRGQSYPASDLYSLAVTCVCLLTGSLPRDSGSNDLYDTRSGMWRWRDYLPKGTVISPLLGQVLDKMLQEYVKDRYQSADEVMQALKLMPSSVVKLEVEEKFTQLRDLLAASNWKSADAETVNLMLKTVDREKERWIDINSIQSFPCADLQTIDRLWLEYSKGRFGFSVQKHIWEEIGGTLNPDRKTYEEFCDRVGWHAKGDWLYYSNLTFDLTAPPGHLPSGRAGDIALGVRLIGKFGGFGVERITSLVSRLLECHIA